MKKTLLTLVLSLIGIHTTFAQIGIGTTSPDASAQLELQSNAKGFLPPRMDSDARDDISSPAQGLMIYCTNCGANGEAQVYNGTEWTNMTGGSASAGLYVPDAPTIDGVTSDDGQVEIAFTAPADDGGATITEYTATSDPGDFTGTLSQAGSGTITVSGLTNGTEYKFKVTATNAVGTSTASAASSSVTPAKVPDAPTIDGVTSGDGQVDVAFTAPADDGGSTITQYTATSNPGDFTGTLSQAGNGTITVSGLTNGTEYTFTVTATNAVGTSTASTASSSVTPAKVPDAPTIDGVTSGDGQVDVAFTAPADDGGSTITEYTATSEPDNKTGTLSQAGNGTITVGGLTNGTEYTFTVTATNAVGTSAASVASASVTPSPPPQVGEYRDGGVVFYVAPTPTDLNGDGTLDQGLVCAVEDQSLGAEWGCEGTSIPGADGTAIGTGADNTRDILAGCTEAGIAAKLCDNYSVDGYNDWFLPSKDELNLMYQNKAAINTTAGSSFASGFYWSSSENSSSNAHAEAQKLSDDGNQSFSGKSNLNSVRAVRAF